MPLFYCFLKKEPNIFILNWASQIRLLALMPMVKEANVLGGICYFCLSAFIHSSVNSPSFSGGIAHSPCV